MATILEFATPSSNSFPGARNTVRLFQAPSENHFKTNKVATPQQLQEAFNNGLPNVTPGSYSTMINRENKDDWLDSCLLKDEKSDDIEVCLIMEEKIHSDKPNGERWLKVALYHKVKKHYLLRSITNKFYNNISPKNPNWNKQSKNENWWICLSTIGADIEFFNTLRDVLGY